MPVKYERVIVYVWAYIDLIKCYRLYSTKFFLLIFTLLFNINVKLLSYIWRGTELQISEKKIVIWSFVLWRFLSN
jgi:hypothetical protein